MNRRNSKIYTRLPDFILAAEARVRAWKLGTSPARGKSPLPSLDFRWAIPATAACLALGALLLFPPKLGDEQAPRRDPLPITPPAPGLAPPGPALSARRPAAPAPAAPEAVALAAQRAKQERLAELATELESNPRSVALWNEFSRLAGELGDKTGESLAQDALKRLGA